MDLVQNPSALKGHRPESRLAFHRDISHSHLADGMGAQSADLFDGCFDNRVTDCREVWQDGTMRRFARRNALDPHSVWPELRKPWGEYPDLPTNASQVAA